MVIPVRDGERWLGDVLAALERERPDEVLVIDSGSRDRWVELARAAGVELIEIEPNEFGHGRTRNLGAERTSGELICFLTQDAIPAEGWLAAHREAFELDERVGASYGPHLPRGRAPPIRRVTRSPPRAARPGARAGAPPAAAPGARPRPSPV